ncbi:MAG: hypothetical protein RLN88_09420 [Ekhidna sp.]|uniref:hypothetical protein n=1 Tax=Ekhidna sp. TaxID=2608089 RepID=UPI0032ED8979
MKNLRQFLKEFTLITLSILIAFWIEDYREQKNNDRDTKELLINIKQDILGNSEILREYSLMQESAIIPAMNSVLIDLEDCIVDSTHTLVNFLSFTPVLHLRFEGYENLKNSGLLSNIEDDTLLHGFKPISLELRYIEDNKKRRELLENKLVEISYPAIYSTERKEWITKQSKFLLTAEECGELNFLLSAWIHMEQEFSIQMSYTSESIKTWLPRLNREIEAK